MTISWPARAAGRVSLVVVATVAVLAAGGCKGSGSAAADAAPDGAGDSKEVGLAACPEPEAASATASADDFGPDAKAVTMASAMGRINVYEVTSPHLLERVDVFVRADLAGSRVTLSVYEAPSMTKPFTKVADVQVDVPSCEGWASNPRRRTFRPPDRIEDADQRLAADADLGQGLGQGLHAPAAADVAGPGRRRGGGGRRWRGRRRLGRR